MGIENIFVWTKLSNLKKKELFLRMQKKPLRHWKRGLRMKCNKHLLTLEREPRELNHLQQRIHVSKIGRKHIFTINKIMSGHDEGTYTCHAVNEIGEAKHNFQVAITENVLMSEPVSSGRNNLHHDDQGWNEGPPHWTSESVRFPGGIITKNVDLISAASPRIHKYNNFVFTFFIPLCFILLR